MMHDALEPGGAACQYWKHVGIEPLREDLPAAMLDVAAKSPS
jgi:hypothetical protein